jgi:enoyl-CoA hydratase/carnithine racemase
MSEVEFSRADAVGLITFSNPPLNLMTFEMFDAFDAAIDEAATSGIRALVLQSDGEHFMAGANVAVFKDVPEAEARWRFSRGLPMLHRLEDLPFPTIAAVQGVCAAAGLELALCCDLIICGRSSRFAQVEILIGTSTLLGGVQRLAERCGAARAREIIYEGSQYDADTFERWNIVNRVVADEDVRSSALELAAKYAAGPTRAYAVGKRLVREYCDVGVRSADRVILDIAAPLFETHDMQHGVRTLLTGGARSVRSAAEFVGA